MTAPVNPVEAVRERLGENGERWHKGEKPYGPGRDGDKVCLGLACLGLGSRTAVEVGAALEQVIFDQYRDRVTDDEAVFGLTIPAFNDHPDTEWSDVDAVTEKAALLVAERVEL